MLTALMLVLMSQPVRVDTRGHELRAIQLGLEAQLEAIEDCSLGPPAPATVQVGWERSVVTLSIALEVTGAVISAKVENPGHFDAPCVEHVLHRAHFAPMPENPQHRTTLVSAELSCLRDRCRWSWAPKSDDAAMRSVFDVSRSWFEPSSSTTFVFAADGGVATSRSTAGRWHLMGRTVRVRLDEADGGHSSKEFTVEDGGLVGPRERLEPGTVELVEDVRLRGGVPCDDACPPRQTCLALQTKCRKAPCPLVSRCVYE